MTTSVLLAQRLTRNLTVDSMAALPAGEVARVMDAINDGLLEYFTFLPDYRKNAIPQPVALLRAPVSMQISIADEATDFTFVDTFPAGGYADASALLGHSVMIQGDGRLNRMLAAGKLMLPYFGPAGSNVTATFYGDCTPFGQDVIKINDEPRWQSESAQLAAALRLLDSDRPEARNPYIDEPQYGDPLYWWTEALQPLENPRWLLRVWPLPTTRGTLAFSAQMFPTALTFSDMTAPRTLPIPDRELNLVLGLIEDRLRNSPMWSPTADKTTAMQDAARARESLRSLNSPQNSAPSRIATPENF
jgi:hypothetical protein